MNKDDIDLFTKMDDEQMGKDILRLEADLEVMGWDIPARIYAVMGKPGDYQLEMITEVSGHPVDFMRSAVLGDKEHDLPGGRLNDDVAGVALAVEGWRHPNAKDIERRDPDSWKYFTDLAESLGITDHDQILEHVNNAMSKAHANIAPSDNPMRIEIRSVMVVMRDGSALSVNRDRDGEPELTEVGTLGRVPRAMKAVLTGCWPADEVMNTPTPRRD